MAKRGDKTGKSQKDSTGSSVDPNNLLDAMVEGEVLLFRGNGVIEKVAVLSPEEVQATKARTDAERQKARAKNARKRVQKIPAATDHGLFHVDDGVIFRAYDPDDALADLEAKYLSGDSTAVLAALFVCCDVYQDYEVHFGDQSDDQLVIDQTGERPILDGIAHGMRWSRRDVPIPDWVKTAFRRHYSDVLLGKARGWDDAFGIPHPKDRKIKAYRKQIQLAGRVFRDIEAARKRGQSVNALLFDEVGERLGISKTTAEEYYRQIRDGIYG